MILNTKCFNRQRKAILLIIVQEKYFLVVSWISCLGQPMFSLNITPL